MQLLLFVQSYNGTTVHSQTFGSKYCQHPNVRMLKMHVVPRPKMYISEHNDPNYYAWEIQGQKSIMWVKWESRVWNVFWACGERGKWPSTMYRVVKINLIRKLTLLKSIKYFWLYKKMTASDICLLVRSISS